MSFPATTAGAIGSSVWLGFFAFKHVDYAQQLWWQFELHGDASRFMRASVGVAVVTMAAGIARLIDHAPHQPAPPTEAELSDAARVIASQQSTTPNLVFLRDKSLLFNEARDGFVMYAVQGRSWIVMGDPVGPDHAVPGLIRQFLERCDDYGGIPVFYEVGPAYLHHYADAGLTFVRLGEDARVDLAAFTLQGGRGSRFRQALRRLERARASFRVVPSGAVSTLLSFGLLAVSTTPAIHAFGVTLGVGVTLVWLLSPLTQLPLPAERGEGRGEGPTTSGMH